MRNLVAQTFEVVGSSEKAIQVQLWFGGGSNPDANARTFWIPKSACEATEKFLTKAATWWISRNRLWEYVT